MNKEILKAFLTSITGNDIMKTNNDDFGCVDEFINSFKYKELMQVKNDVVLADVKHRFSANDVDRAYLLGVFNVSGIDGLQNELNRLKQLEINPNQIINNI